MATVSAMFTITDTGDLNGRNLIQRSFFTKEPWTGPANAIGDGFGLYHDKYCLPVTMGILYTNTNKGTNNLFPDLEFEEGVQYTLSGKWAQFRTDDKYNLFRLIIYHTDGTSVYVRQPEQNETWLSFKLTSTAGKTVDKITTTYGYGGVVYIADFKLEVGKAATDWTPAPEDVNTALDTAKGTVTAFNDYIAGNEIIVGTQTASTSHWTGVAGFKELKDGQKITYWLPVASTSTAVDLNLTLAGGEKTGAIPVFYRSTTRATTHFPANCPVTLNYRENVKIGSTTYAKGWWADVSYYVNQVDRLQLSQPIKIKTGFTTDYPFIVSDNDGYFMLAPNKPFDVTKAILYYNSTADTTSGGTTTGGYLALSQCNLRRNKSDADLAVGASCYIEGILNGSTFTPSSRLFTDTPVNDQNGYYYLLLGYVTSKNSTGVYITLYPEHPIFKFVNGVFKSLNQVAYEANTLASEAKSAAESKNSVYYQTTAPTGTHKVGDTWFDTTKANDYKISRWNGSNWVAAKLGDQAIGNLNASHINAGTLTAVDIGAGKSQDIAGTIKVYDEDDAVKVSLDKDGLMATKGKIGNWNISSYSIQYQKDVPSGEDAVIGGDGSEELIGIGTPTLVGGETLILKICTYDPANPNLGPHIISSVVENGADPQYDNGKTMRISNGGLACYYNRNTGTTGGSVNINPKLISVGSGEYDEDQVLWRDSANLNPGSLVIACFKTESGEEQQLMGRSYLTYRDLSFVGDVNNPQLASGIAHWSILAPRRTIKGELGVTIYHCGNLFWAHFDGTISAGWTASNTINVYIPIITGDTDLSNSVLVAPPEKITKYIIPSDLTNMRISVAVRTEGQLGISRIAEPFKGNATTTIAGYMESCDIFWAHIG